MADNNKQTALYNFHISQGAKCVPFGGYLLPVWYSNLKAEHLAVRNTAGCFDISHMGLILLSGKDAKKVLQRITCNDVSKCDDFTMTYSMVLNEDGGILDDVMFSLLPGQETTYLLIVNASNTSKILNWISDYNHENVSVLLLNSTHSFIAIQGPHALDKISSILDVSDLDRFKIKSSSYKETFIWISRTGYTGEDGIEVIIPNESAEQLWKQCLEADVTPCGLGARDTLRLEAGLPLYGQELDETLTPYETRYKWVVKGSGFLGEKAIASHRESPEWATVGFEMEERVIARAGYDIKEGGKVTSGTLSPSLDKPVGMALVPLDKKETGSIIHIKIRGKYHKATVTKVPFL